MRWNIVKQAWSLAREKFPKAKRLFVELPDRFRGFGECAVLDLETPDKPLGKITYEAHCEDGKPVLSMKLQDGQVKTAMPRFASLDMKTESSEAQLAKKFSICAADIMAKYPEPRILGEQIAYLIAGHEDGLSKTAELDEYMVHDWVEKHGFPAESVFHAEEKLDELGLKIARKKEKKFKNFEKVRIVDPGSRDYNEGAQIIGRKRDKDKNDWYQVIVDGSSQPIWLNERQLAKNEVGSLKTLSVKQLPAKE
jgi:hypothetical protein